MAERIIKFEIKRQSSPDGTATWEKFELPFRNGMNVISAMMEIAANMPWQRWYIATSFASKRSAAPAPLVINGRAHGLFAP
jgi:hypothetical protein